MDLAMSQPVAAPAPENWRDYFRSMEQLEEGDVRMILDGFLPEGVNMIGALAGRGKTLFALSLIKSLTTGERFLGRYKPADIIPVIYMIPESSSRAFKMRCKLFGIPNDPKVFLCRTVTEGKTLMLDDPILLEAVKHLHPVVILDTLPRFNESDDENSGSANKQLVNDITTLRALGAAAVIGLHHSTKASAEQEQTLENVLRGTGDLGAMADSVYALRRNRLTYNNGAGANELDVVCVKPRDFEPPVPFKIAASYKKGDGKIVSYINETGDFHVIEMAAVIFSQDEAFIKAISDDPTVSSENLAEDLGISTRKLRSQIRRLGYSRTHGKHGRWILKSQPSPTVYLNSPKETASVH
jgi:hypothetical protein